MLNALKAAFIKLNVKKCNFGLNSIEFLGYKFDQNGVKPCENKIDAIINAPAPTNVNQVQSFIGLCNFYSRFIPNFSTVMSPLYLLLHKKKVLNGTRNNNMLLIM